MSRTGHGISPSVVGEASDRSARLWLIAGAVNGFITQGVSEHDFVKLRKMRDATLKAPLLILRMH